MLKPCSEGSGVSDRLNSYGGCIHRVMAQPHKGPRRLVGSRIPEEVYLELRRRADDAGVSVSQYVADVMAIYAGYPEEVRELSHTTPLFSRDLEVSLAESA